MAVVTAFRDKMHVLARPMELWNCLQHGSLATQEGTWPIGISAVYLKTCVHSFHELI